VFYYGYFIYTTLEHKAAQLFSDYFFSNSDSFEINPTKVFGKFVHVENPDTWDHNHTYGAVLNIRQNRGFLLGTSEQDAAPQVNSPQLIPQSNSQSNPQANPQTNAPNTNTQNNAPNTNSPSDNLNGMGVESNNGPQANANGPQANANANSNANAQGTKKFCPIVWIKNADGTLTPYKLCIYYDSGLMVMMYYELGHDLNLNSLNEIRYAVSKNIKKCSTNLDRNIESIYAQEDTNKLYYLNKANLAMRVNKSFLKFIDAETSRVIWDMKNTFADKSDCRVVINKFGTSWTYAKEFTSRRVFLIIDGEVSLAKIEDEKKRILGMDLPTILC